MPVDVKICGLSTAAAVDCAVEGGAAMCGFVFFPPSPRSLSPAQAAPLAEMVPSGVLSVGLMVDAEDHEIDQILDRAQLDLLQLHGRESAWRVAEIRDKFRIPVMKAVPIAASEDLAMARMYESAADRLLFDARPPRGATRPGGNALAFDWELLSGKTWSRPWLLAGGLTADNLAEAVRTSGATFVDVSSGVEDAPGVKNLTKIRLLLEAARNL